MVQRVLKPGDVFVPYKMFRGIFIPNGIVQMKDLTATTKLVYGVLNKYAGKDGKCYPKQSTIANDIGISKRRIITHLNRLEKVRLITRTRPEGGDRLAHKTTRYSFLFHKCFLSEDDKTVTSEDDASITLEPEGNDTSIIGSYESDSVGNISSKEEIEVKETSGVSAKLIKRKSKADKMRNRSKESLQREIDPIEAPNISAKILPFINYWEEQGLIQHERNTKTFISAVKNLNKVVSRGTLFNNMTDFEEFADTKLSFEDFTLAVDNYIKARSHDYLPAEKKWLNYSLANFLYNPFGKNGRTKSPLIYFMMNPPVATVPDHYPDITLCIIKQFAEWNPDYKPTAKDKKKFIHAGNRTGDFFIKHKNKITDHFKLGAHKQAELVIRAVRKDVQDQGLVITPGYLCSNTTFDHRLPAYLKNQAIFSSVDRRRFR